MSVDLACIRLSSVLALAGLCAACADPGAVGPSYAQSVQPYAAPYAYAQPVQPYGYVPGYPPPVYGYAAPYEPAPTYGFGVFEEGERRDHERHERGEWHEHAGPERDLDHYGGGFRPAALPPPPIRNAPPPAVRAAPPASSRPTAPQAAANVASPRKLGFPPNH